MWGKEAGRNRDEELGRQILQWDNEYTWKQGGAERWKKVGRDQISKGHISYLKESALMLEATEIHPLEGFKEGAYVRSLIWLQCEEWIVGVRIWVRKNVRTWMQKGKWWDNKEEKIRSWTKARYRGGKIKLDFQLKKNHWRVAPWSSTPTSARETVKGTERRRLCECENLGTNKLAHENEGRSGLWPTFSPY